MVRRIWYEKESYRGKEDGRKTFNQEEEPPIGEGGVTIGDTVGKSASECGS